MTIELKEAKTVKFEEEKHYKILINGKEVWVTSYHNEDEFGCEGDTEIFKGKELLTEDEEEAVLEYISQMHEIADKGL